jgi:hypothetical protein
MKIVYVHASVYGNGARAAEEFRALMAGKGVEVFVSHVKDVKPKQVPSADLYVFSSPGRIGKPIGSMRSFLKKAVLPAGARYALLATEPMPDPSRPAPPPEEYAKWQRVIPIMDELLQLRGFVKVAEAKVLVHGMKGPLEDGLEKKVEAFASAVLGK